MGTFNLSGTGVQALSAGTTALHITITTLPGGLSHGRANPTNHFDIALLRFSDGTGYWPAIPVLGGPDWIGVPVGSTSVGYAVLNGAVLSVTEIIGGTSPDPVISVTAPIRLMPQIISPASAEILGAELAANAVQVLTSGTWATANLSALYPLRVTATYTSAFAWVLNGTTSSGHWDIGVYDTSLALLGHTGSQLQVGASQFQSTAFVIVLAPGFYWLAMSADATTLTTGLFTVSGITRVRLIGARQSLANFPLASGPALVAPTFSSLPAFGLSTYSPS